MTYKRRMKRYFFHTSDGTIERDLIGTELASDNEARSTAVKFAAKRLVERPEMMWESSDFRVDVTDVKGETLFTMICVAIDGPAYWNKRMQHSVAINDEQLL